MQLLRTFATFGLGLWFVSSAVPAEPTLRVLDHKCENRNGYAVASGHVKNLSSERLRNVEAVLFAIGPDGDRVESTTALIEYTPLLPGQISPFKALMRWNPAFKRCIVEFRLLATGERLCCGT